MIEANNKDAVPQPVAGKLEIIRTPKKVLIQDKDLPTQSQKERGAYRLANFCVYDLIPGQAARPRCLSRIYAHQWKVEVNESGVHVNIIILEQFPINLHELKSIRPFSLEEGLRAGHRIWSCLYHLHGIGITHGDIKPANVMVDATGETIKIVDLGGATYKTMTITNSYTLQYSSPFLVFDAAHGNERPTTSPAYDLYSVAVAIADTTKGRIDEWNKGVKNNKDITLAAKKLIENREEIPLEKLFEHDKTGILARLATVVNNNDVMLEDKYTEFHRIQECPIKNLRAFNSR